MFCMIVLTGQQRGTGLMLAEFERFIRRDPGGRGLIGPDNDADIGVGDLAAAAVDLAKHAKSVALMTGFFIPVASDQASGKTTDIAGFAETDGPLGTCLLAAVLVELGIEVRVLTDVNCEAVVRSAARAQGLAAEVVLASPLQSHEWRSEFWSSDFAQQLTHLIAIERVGPSHTRDSLQAQGASESQLRHFEQAVSEPDRGRCFNMRGVPIDAYTGDLHALFDELRTHRPRARSASVGDGGNEIGMGRFAWDTLRQRLSTEVGAKIPCRIATDHTILAGTSNWGAYALAAAIACVRQRCEVLARQTADHERHVLETIVREARAVDGVTRRHEATVDGLPFLTYIQPWLGIRRLLGLEP